LKERLAEEIKGLREKFRRGIERLNVRIDGLEKGIVGLEKRIGSLERGCLPLREE
jgi:exonuclease VII small subunit